MPGDQPDAAPAAAAAVADVGREEQKPNILWRGVQAVGEFYTEHRTASNVVLTLVGLGLIKASQPKAPAKKDPKQGDSAAKSDSDGAAPPKVDAEIKFILPDGTEKVITADSKKTGGSRKLLAAGAGLVMFGVGSEGGARLSERRAEAEKAKLRKQIATLKKQKQALQETVVSSQATETTHTQTVTHTTTLLRTTRTELTAVRTKKVELEATVDGLRTQLEKLQLDVARLSALGDVQAMCSSSSSSSGSSPSASSSSTRPSGGFWSRRQGTSTSSTTSASSTTAASTISEEELSYSS